MCKVWLQRGAPRTVQLPTLAVLRVDRGFAPYAGVSLLEPRDFFDLFVLEIGLLALQVSLLRTLCQRARAPGI